MGTKAIEILGIDPEELIELLNKALADEWLAYYQYWIGSKVIIGPMRDAVIAELNEHAADELRHADMLAERILQLGGTPILEPKKWYEMCNCEYAAPHDPAVKKILAQNIEAEQCAIVTYDKVLKMVDGKDPVTYEIILEILRDEIDHEDDLQTMEEDLQNI
ncbi:MAG: ferritin-like domain-containing protein [Chlamydiota bacterium]